MQLISPPPPSSFLLPLEKLSEYLRVFRYPSICCEVLLTFKILLLRFSPHHLMAFWPAMTAELVSYVRYLYNVLSSEVIEILFKMSLQTCDLCSELILNT